MFEMKEYFLYWLEDYEDSDMPMFLPENTMTEDEFNERFYELMNSFCK